MVVLTVTNTSKAIHAMAINYFFFLSFLYQRNSGNGVEHEIIHIFFVKLGEHILTCASHKEEVVSASLLL